MIVVIIRTSFKGNLLEKKKKEKRKPSHNYSPSFALEEKGSKRMIFEILTNFCQPSRDPFSSPGSICDTEYSLMML